MSEDINHAREDVNEALERAKEARSMGQKLADGWRKSRQDNNFRAMIRNLAPGGAVSNGSH